MDDPTTTAARPRPTFEENAPAALPAKLWRWWRLRSRRGLVVEGALPSPAAAEFVARLRAGSVLPVPMDAEGPDDADVVVVVGHISAQLALRLAGLRERLPPGAVVIAFDMATPVHSYAVGAADAVIEVDILVKALPPSDAAIDLVIQQVLDRATGPSASVASAPSVAMVRR
jgi:hypothetical protein